MSNRKPKIDMWSHLAARDGATSILDPDNAVSLEESQRRIVKEEGRRPTPNQRERMCKGYYIGRINGVHNHLSYRLWDLSKDQLKRFADELIELMRRHEQEWDNGSQ